MGEGEGNGSHSDGKAQPRWYGLPRIDILMLLERMRGATGAEWSVLILVTSRCHWITGKRSYPPLDAVAMATGVDRRTVQRSLQSLQDRNILLVAQRGGGRGLATTWDINPDLMKKGGSDDALLTPERAGEVTPFTPEKGGMERQKGGKNGRKGVIPPAPTLTTTLTNDQGGERPLPSPSASTTDGIAEAYVKADPTVPLEKATNHVQSALDRGADPVVLLAKVQELAGAMKLWTICDLVLDKPKAAPFKTSERVCRNCGDCGWYNHEQDFVKGCWIEKPCRFCNPQGLPKAVRK